MDKPADPATPFAEVYQHFLAVLRKHGRKESTLAKYLYDFKRFERWLRASGLPLTLASLIDTDLLFAYRHYLEALPQQARGSARQRNDGMLSNKTVHSYLRSTKCLASWLTKNGHIAKHPFLALDPYFKDEGVMPVLRKMDRIPKIATPADIRILLTACAGDEPEDLRDRAIVWTLYSSGMRASDTSKLTIPQVDLVTGIAVIEDGKGNKDRQAFVQAIAAGYVKAYIERARPALLERKPKRSGPLPAGATNLVETDLLFISSRRRGREVGIGASGILQMLTRRYKQGGGTLSSFGPHRLRHGMATYLAEQGVDRAEIQRWGGWSDISTVDIYIHQDTTRVRADTDRAQRSRRSPRTSLRPRPSGGPSRLAWRRADRLVRVRRTDVEDVDRGHGDLLRPRPSGDRRARDSDRSVAFPGSADGQEEPQGQAPRATEQEHGRSRRRDLLRALDVYRSRSTRRVREAE